MALERWRFGPLLKCIWSPKSSTQCAQAGGRTEQLSVRLVRLDAVYDREGELSLGKIFGKAFVLLELKDSTLV